MFEEINAQTVSQLLKLLDDPALQKGITVATGLQPYNLQAPAESLYPVLSPYRNETPRTKGLGAAAHWKALTALAASGEPSVAEGARNSEISFTEVDKTAAYKTWGRDSSVTWEADIQGKGYDDTRARSALGVLQQVMIEEEDLIVGGNATLALGTPGAITTSASGTGALLPTLTYDVTVVALPYFGMRQISALTLPARHSQKATVVTQAVTLGQTLYASVPAVAGAVAYAWFIGASGASKLEKITYINSMSFATALAGTGATAASVAADTSTNSLNFDGMLTQLFANGYVKTMDTGTAGTGTTLTSDGAGGIVEIDAVLQYLWDSLRVGADTIAMNSQEAMNINKKIVGAGGSPVFHFVEQTNADGRTIVAGSRIGAYANKFTQPDVVKLRIHPTVPKGTMMFTLKSLPAHFPNANIPGAWEMELVADYYEEIYARSLRKHEHGVYANGVLKGHIPGFQAILTNIGNG